MEAETIGQERTVFRRCESTKETQAEVEDELLSVLSTAITCKIRCAISVDGRPQQEKNGARRAKLRLVEEVDEAVGDLSTMVVGNASGGGLDLFHQAAEVVSRGGDGDHAESRRLPEVGGIDLGDGDVEAGAETVLEAAQNLTAVLERLCAFNAEFEGEVRDGHESRRR